MAGVPLVETIPGNNNASHTDVFRRYIKDNFEEVRANCTVISVDGRTTSQFQNNSSGMWIELGLDAKYILIADYLNGIDGEADLMYLDTIYLPDTRYLDEIARRVNNR